MDHLRSVPFEFDGKSYEVRVFRKDGRFCVRAYLGNNTANGYEYCVDEITGIDFQLTRGISAIDHLIEIAKHDVENKFWENYVAAVEALKATET